MAFLEGRKEDVREALKGLTGPVKTVIFTQRIACETCGAAETLAREAAVRATARTREARA